MAKQQPVKYIEESVKTYAEAPPSTLLLSFSVR